MTSTTPLSAADRALAARFVDGALDTADAIAFRRRIAAEPPLAAAVDELLGMRRMFAADAARTAATTARGTFVESVLRQTRRLPNVDDEDVVRLARRLLVAAALLLALGVLAASGWLRPTPPGRLEASPGLVEELRLRIQERESPPRSGAERTPDSPSPDQPTPGQPSGVRAPR